MNPIKWKDYNNKKYKTALKALDHTTPYAVPLPYAFGAVLADLHLESQKLFFASDNIRHEVGADVHLGPFSTKNFIEWAEYEGYIDVGVAASSQVVGYTFTLTDRVPKGLQRLRNQFRKYINVLLEQSPINEDASVEEDNEWTTPSTYEEEPMW